jgi:hypothetical protein
MEGELQTKQAANFKVVSEFTIARTKILGRASALAQRVANKSVTDCFQILTAYDRETCEQLANITDDDIRAGLVELARMVGIELRFSEQETAQ